MSKPILLALAFLLTGVLQAQNSVDQLFDKYSEDETFRVINVTSTMFKLMAQKDKVEANPDLAKLINDLESMKVLSNESNGKGLYNEILPSIQENFEHIMTIKEDGEDVEMFIHEGEEHVEQFVAVARRGDAFVLIDLRGVIDLQTIGKLGETLDAPGLNYLEQLKK